jgi:hypothetical protein
MSLFKSGTGGKCADVDDKGNPQCRTSALDEEDRSLRIWTPQEDNKERLKERLIDIARFGGGT